MRIRRIFPSFTKRIMLLPRHHAKNIVNIINGSTCLILLKFKVPRLVNRGHKNAYSEMFRCIAFRTTSRYIRKDIGIIVKKVVPYTTISSDTDNKARYINYNIIFKIRGQTKSENYIWHIK